MILLVTAALFHNILIVPARSRVCHLILLINANKQAEMNGIDVQLLPIFRVKPCYKYLQRDNILKNSTSNFDPSLFQLVRLYYKLGSIAIKTELLVGSLTQT